MNKKKIFLGLAVLFCANQISAGVMDSLRSGWNNAATWVVSLMPESWQGRACAALGVCALTGIASYRLYVARNWISMTGARAAIDTRASEISKRDMEVLTQEVQDGCNLSDHRAFKAKYSAWDNDKLVAAYKYLKSHNNQTSRARANEILGVWVEKALGKKISNN